MLVTPSAKLMTVAQKLSEILVHPLGCLWCCTVESILIYIVVIALCMYALNFKRGREGNFFKILDSV